MEAGSERAAAAAAAPAAAAAAAAPAAPPASPAPPTFLSLWVFSHASYMNPDTTPKAHSVSIALLAVPAGPLFCGEEVFSVQVSGASQCSGVRCSV